MGAAVTLAERDRNLRDRRFSISVEQFGAVGDDAAIFLLRAAEEAGDIHQGDQGNVESVAEPDETGRLTGGIDVQDARQYPGLVGDDAYALPTHAGESDEDVFGEILVDFEETVVVDNAPYDVVHVVGLVGLVGDDRV